LACLLACTFAVASAASPQSPPLASQIMDQPDPPFLRLAGWSMPTYRRPPAQKACRAQCIGRCNATLKYPSDAYERCEDACVNKCNNVR
jgi:hypothetical protein